MTRCPRCGELMNGGICDNCGFPMKRPKRIILQAKKDRERKQRGVNKT